MVEDPDADPPEWYEVIPEDGMDETMRDAENTDEPPTADAPSEDIPMEQATEAETAGSTIVERLLHEQLLHEQDEQHLWTTSSGLLDNEPSWLLHDMEVIVTFAQTQTSWNKQIAKWSELIANESLDGNTILATLRERLTHWGARAPEDYPTASTRCTSTTPPSFPQGKPLRGSTILLHIRLQAATERSSSSLPTS